MDFELSEEQRAFQDLARGFAETELAPQAAAWDEHCVFPVESLRAAAKLGFAGIYVGEDAVVAVSPCRHLARLSATALP